VTNVQQVTVNVEILFHGFKLLWVTFKYIYKAFNGQLRNTNTNASNVLI
jgi:hypothetical protein